MYEQKQSITSTPFIGREPYKHPENSAQPTEKQSKTYQSSLDGNTSNQSIKQLPNINGTAWYVILAQGSYKTSSKN